MDILGCNIADDIWSKACHEKSAEDIGEVMVNKGAPGVDGMEVSKLPEYFETHWTVIRKQIVSRKYKPKPVLRVEIPKDNGGIRLLGIPAEIYRVIQQAMVQGTDSGVRVDIQRLQFRVSPEQECRRCCSTCTNLHV